MLRHRAAVAHELECIASILSRQNQFYLRAAKILGTADSLRRLIESMPTPVERAEYDKEVASMREKTGEAEFEKAWEQGQGPTMDEAIRLATQED